MANEFQKIATVAVILIVGLYVVSSVFGALPATTTVVANEQVTIDVGNSTQVSKTYGTKYFENETIYNSNNVKLVEGTDYQWYPSNQSIRWYSTTDVTDGNNADVNYAFRARSQTARRSVGTISQAFTLGAVAVIVVVASLILALVSGFGQNNGGGRGGGRL